MVRDFGVRKPQDTHATCLEEACSLGVVLRCMFRKVLAAVDFNNQPSSVAIKVQDVVSELVLASEFVAFQLTRAEDLPEDSFGICGVLAQFARSGIHAPSP